MAESGSEGGLAIASVSKEELGRGSHGTVHRATLTDGTTCVVKRIALDGLSQEDVEQSRREAHATRSICHPHVVRCFCIEQSESELRIAQELCEGGNLAEYLSKRQSLLPERDAMAVFVQLIIGLHAVHARKTLHRDLKTSNILISKDPMCLKLGDFGLCKILDKTENLASTVLGTPHYISPEACKAKKYGFKSDMWSLGVCLYVVSSLRHPFEASNLAALVMKVLRGQYPPLSSGYSAEMRGIVGSLLQQNPQRRPSASALLATPYLRSFAEAYAQVSVESFGQPKPQLPEKLSQQPPNALQMPNPKQRAVGKQQQQKNPHSTRTARSSKPHQQHQQHQHPRRHCDGQEEKQQVGEAWPSEAIARHRQNVRNAKPRVTREELKRRRFQTQEQHKQHSTQLEGDIICAPGPNGIRTIPIGHDFEDGDDEKQREDTYPNEEFEADDDQEGSGEEEVGSDEPTAADVERLRAQLEKQLGDRGLWTAYREVRASSERNESPSLETEEQQQAASDILKLVLLEDAVFCR